MALGVNDVDVVPEQAEPDGTSPLRSYPNPEFREAPPEPGPKLPRAAKPFGGN